MLELDHKEGWAPKNWCFSTVVLRRLLRVPWTTRRSNQSILHQLNGHESEQIPGDVEGQGSLACCSLWGHKELDMTEWLNNLICSKSILISLSTPAPLGFPTSIHQSEAWDLLLTSFSVKPHHQYRSYWFQLQYLSQINSIPIPQTSPNPTASPSGPGSSPAPAAGFLSSSAPKPPYTLLCAVRVIPALVISRNFCVVFFLCTPCVIRPPYCLKSLVWFLFSWRHLIYPPYNLLCTEQPLVYLKIINQIVLMR